VRRLLLILVSVSTLVSLAIVLAPTASVADTDTIDKCGSTAPCPRGAMGMAFDNNPLSATYRNILVFGGASNTFAFLRDTWAYNITTGTWTNKTVAIPPCTRHSTRMVYDEHNGNIVMFGGDAGTDCTDQSSGTLGDTWTWDGTTWNQCTSCSPGVNAPTYRASENLSWDGRTGDNYVLLFGGTGACTPSPCGDTWEWTGSVWSQVCQTCSPIGPDPTRPSDRSTSAIAYSAARDGGTVILHGGNDGTGVVDGTWEWPRSSSQTWLGLANIGSPSPRMGARMAYDAATASQQLVMFGGCTGGCSTPNGDLVAPSVNETFILGPTGNWSQMTGIPAGLTGRCCVGIAYATSSPFSKLGNTAGIFMFGGEDSSNNKLGERGSGTWTPTAPLTGAR
jgi:hypothetical protein